MEKKKGNMVRLGVFVTLGILFFIIGIYIIGQKQRLFSDTFTISGIFKNVNGLQVGNNVRFTGINVGTVDDIIILNDTSVQVVMIVDEDTHRFIKKDAKAIIGSEGLMGNKTINITPGSLSQTPVAENGFILTDQPVNTDEILSKLKTTADNLASITDNVSSGKGTIGKLFMDTNMANSLNQTIINLKHGTKGFEENMDAAKHSVLLRGAVKRMQKDKEKK
jgi:phospholipid/cholesterol/gamma-HCH transport system substrate-binding protein